MPDQIQHSKTFDDLEVIQKHCEIGTGRSDAVDQFEQARFARSGTDARRDARDCRIEVCKEAAKIVVRCVQIEPPDNRATLLPPRRVLQHGRRFAESGWRTQHDQAYIACVIDALTQLRPPQLKQRRTRRSQLGRQEILMHGVLKL
ncbi:hypothetical protein [Paraburkholderia gardini]|uniref:hypothetical protein n=1 Tax=Paraburkholderia gardini TaxID=2823469 RepID=UPI001E578DAA|nr:hypothetical protein [Paraburkholderia gardini]